MCITSVCFQKYHIMVSCRLCMHHSLLCQISNHAHTNTACIAVQSTRQAAIRIQTFQRIGMFCEVQFCKFCLQLLCDFNFCDFEWMNAGHKYISICLQILLSQLLWKYHKTIQFYGNTTTSQIETYWRFMTKSCYGWHVQVWLHTIYVSYNRVSPFDS